MASSRRCWRTADRRACLTSEEASKANKSGERSPRASIYNSPRYPLPTRATSTLPPFSCFTPGAEQQTTDKDGPHEGDRDDEGGEDDDQRRHPAAPAAKEELGWPPSLLARRFLCCCGRGCRVAVEQSPSLGLEEGGCKGHLCAAFRRGFKHFVLSQLCEPPDLLRCRNK